MTSIETEARDIVKAAEHVTTPDQMHAVQREVAAQMKSMSPSDYRKLIDRVVDINAQDCAKNPHLPHLFQIVQPGSVNNRNIGFEFAQQTAPEPDGKVGKELSTIQGIITRGGPSAGEHVEEELKRSQETMTTGEFRQLYLDAYDAERKHGGPNPISPVGADWKLLPQKP